MDLRGYAFQDIDFEASKSFWSSNHAYTYGFHSLGPSEEVNFSDLGSMTVLLLEGSLISETGATLRAGDSIQTENASLFLKNGLQVSKLLVAGITKSPFDTASTKVSKAEDTKLVSKPWGRELWISGEHPGYSLKQIFIKQGARTSLQYHKEKRETGILFSGRANFHYKLNQHVANEDVSEKDLSLLELKPYCSMDILPGKLHRLEAISDVLLYEVSSPQLDDVIRIKDDTLRGHGRIQLEHLK